MEDLGGIVVRLWLSSTPYISGVTFVAAECVHDTLPVVIDLVEEGHKGHIFDFRGPAMEVPQIINGPNGKRYRVVLEEVG